MPMTKIIWIILTTIIILTQTTYGLRSSDHRPRGMYDWLNADIKIRCQSKFLVIKLSLSDSWTIIKKLSTDLVNGNGFT